MALSSLLLLHFLFFFFFIIFVEGHCLDDQKKLLLDLKSEFKLDSTRSEYMVRWNETDDDCCQWGGVVCDEAGHIINLYLHGDGISGRIGESSSLLRLTYLSELALSSNDFSPSQIPTSIHRLTNLRRLDLSNASFTGPIPSTLANLTELVYLDLSSNSLTSSIPSFLCNLHFIDLSNNNLMGSLSDLHFEGLTNLSFLDLSYNSLNCSIPHHLFCLPSIEILDLSNNQLRFEFPLFPQANRSDKYSTAFLLANNSLTGVIPTSICNASYQIEVLNLSFNNLSGSIPPCLLNKTHVLQALSLRGNKITGVIPDQFSSECRLISFDVSDNKLGGKIPKSLANCKGLKVMNVGNNNFDDSFPCMLPLSLHILVLRSNRFHGDLTCHQSWPYLQILDISSNNFSGTLDPLNLSSWRGMMLQSPAHLRPNRSNSKFLGYGDYYRDEVTITVKSVEVRLVKIWPDFTSIDLSCNHFEGDIPDAIGNLTSLYLLNLSHNALTSAIPTSLGALTELGSLDLSANQLRGRIPEELAQLTFLSILNVSHNHLTGNIPTGPQFQTFSPDSFEGNIGLCGFPLDRSCNKSTHGSGSTPSKSEHEEIEWEYVFAALGYVVGLGSIGWTLLWCRNLRERYFEKIEEVVDKTFYQRARRRRHERRVEKRNEVLRRHHQRG